MSNYPPGVTGNEWQIAGAAEREVDAECITEVDGVECGWMGTIDATSVDGVDWDWFCPRCGSMGFTEIDDEPDPDRYRD